MIKDLILEYIQSQKWSRTWGHDRDKTLGSSEVGGCARKATFAKLGYPPDPGYEQDYGAALRGTNIEDGVFVPALREMIKPPYELIWAGGEQQTFISGELSGTPDGLVIDHSATSRNRRAPCFLIECKSVDPRARFWGNPKVKPENEFQVHTAIGLVRECTEYQPVHAVVLYIDASFYGHMEEFVVPFSQRVYDAAKARARGILTATSPLDISPEGKLTGGEECQYCSWQAQCGEASLKRMPNGGTALSAEAQVELKGLRDLEREMAGRIEDNEQSRAMLQEAIKQFLKDHDARGWRGQGWGVSWTQRNGRVTYDTKAATAAGLDLEPFKKEGKPYDQLSIT